MHRHFLPLYPWAAEQLDLRGYGLVVVSDSGPVKGVRLDDGAVQNLADLHPARRQRPAGDAAEISLVLER